MHLSAEQVQHKSVSANVDTQKIKHKIYVVVGLSSSSKAALETLGLKESKETGAFISFETLIGEFKMPSCERTFKNAIYKPGNCNYVISSPMDHSMWKNWPDKTYL